MASADSVVGGGGGAQADKKANIANSDTRVTAPIISGLNFNLQPPDGFIEHFIVWVLAGGLTQYL